MLGQLIVFCVPHWGWGWDRPHGSLGELAYSLEEENSGVLIKYVYVMLGVYVVCVYICKCTCYMCVYVNVCVWVHVTCVCLCMCVSMYMYMVCLYMHDVHNSGKSKTDDNNQLIRERHDGEEAVIVCLLKKKNSLHWGSHPSSSTSRSLPT